MAQRTKPWASSCREQSPARPVMLRSQRGFCWAVGGTKRQGLCYSDVATQLQLLAGRLKPWVNIPASCRHCISKTKPAKCCVCSSFPSPPPPKLFNFRYSDRRFFRVHLVFVLALLLTELRITMAFVPLPGVPVSSVTPAQLGSAGL